MVRFDLPDSDSEADVERFIGTLAAPARDGVRQMLLAGAGEDEIAEYIESVDRVVADEEEAGFEEDESTSSEG